ncbi:hypothetical protein [Flavobacterium sp.]|uniref:hypothetical protein n=1 Tax=Flavobacterium sp. TaxID=239 RepID=UPI0040340257
MNDIFNRLLQVIEYKGFKSVNEFAISGLNYNSAEKLNRLKKENTKPGFEILYDITNKFADINLNWFVSGEGEMILPFKGVQEPGLKYTVSNASEIVQVKNEMIDLLKQENKELRTDKEFLRDLVKSKIITP